MRASDVTSTRLLTTGDDDGTAALNPFSLRATVRDLLVEAHGIPIDVAEFHARNMTPAELDFRLRSHARFGGKATGSDSPRAYFARAGNFPGSV